MEVMPPGMQSGAAANQPRHEDAFELPFSIFTCLMSARSFDGKRHRLRGGILAARLADIISK